MQKTFCDKGHYAVVFVSIQLFVQNFIKQFYIQIGATDVILISSILLNDSSKDHNLWYILVVHAFPHEVLKLKDRDPPY